MMRSLYSGVSGLKTHQTKMDVIGNNIANVNTTAYKSQSITFSELMYQTTQSASGPNATTGTAGTNAKQIGLGVTSGAISAAITTAGATQTTGNPFDLKITGDAFFIVSNGGDNFFTRDGSFYVDAAGNLATTSTGYNVMGWEAKDVDVPDPDTGLVKKVNQIVQDTVKPLRIMSPENMTFPPEATTNAYVSGILDKNDTGVTSSAGKIISVSFFDGLGYAYTAKFAIKDTAEEGQYNVELTDILDSNNDSLTKVFRVGSIDDIATFGSNQVINTTKLTQLLPGVQAIADTPGDPTTTYTFKKQVANADAFSDFKAKKVNGITYTVPADLAATNNLQPADIPKTFVEGDKFKLAGDGKISKEDMEDAFEMVYIESDASDTNVPYYYINGTHLHDPSKIADATNADLERAAWATALGKEGLEMFDVSFDTDGAVTFSFAQEFTFDAETDFDGVNFTKTITQEEAYGVDTTDPDKTYTFDIAPDGQAQITVSETIKGITMGYNTATGKYDSENFADSFLLDFNVSTTDILGNPIDLSHFSDISIDFSKSSMYNNNGTSTITMVNGDDKGAGSGRKLGELSGVSIQKDGQIYASYDNGQTKLLGQIAVATFANASGLQKEGDNLYSATLNSGEFDGIGVDVTANGGYMSTGVLEMSNVDLSSEFTEMITTQRGFQANSRIITVSDTLLEELVNLKR